MKRTIRLSLLFLVLIFSPGILYSGDRADEIRDEMWNSSDKDFKMTAVPEKWKTRSAVIIAQLHRFEYKKAVMANLLHINEYSHYRVKLIDNNAINKYSEMSYMADQPGMTSYDGTDVYVGFKVIKSNGKEIVVDLANAVKMERQGSGGKIAYKKIAIPNLEPGDILDYYICEETSRIRVNQIEFFDPVIHNLVQEYPVIRQKIQFKVQRRCYINLRSLNGAPELKLVTDEKNDEKYYSLEDGDRDGIADVRWLYRNRELPTIKFRAAYASNAGLRMYNVLLGNQGEVKNNVTPPEIVALTNTLMAGVYINKGASKYLKEKYKGVKDPFVISKAAYYYFRNEALQVSEVSTLESDELPSFSSIRFVSRFSDFLVSKKIPHDIVVGVERNISSLTDVIIENELEYLVRVKKGGEFLYFSAYDIFLTPAFISPRLEGTDAYAIDALYSTSSRVAKRITLPASKAEDNITQTNLTVTISDMSSVKASVTQKLNGFNKLYAQYQMMDVYDALDEDNAKFKKQESFSSYAGSVKKKYTAMKQAYLSSRDKNRNEELKKSIESNYDLKVKDVADFKILQTGRFDDKPEMIVAFNFTTEDLIKKTGPNYLFDIGKLIEGQVKIEAQETERNYGIYLDHTRSFKYTIVFEIPAGYEVQGIENLNQKVENATGGFVSSAKLENGKLIVETHKHYDKTVLSKDQWPAMISFLNAAHTFSGQKILLKKK